MDIKGKSELKEILKWLRDDKTFSINEAQEEIIQVFHNYRIRARKNEEARRKIEANLRKAESLNRLEVEYDCGAGWFPFAVYYADIPEFRAKAKIALERGGKMFPHSKFRLVSITPDSKKTELTFLK